MNEKEILSNCCKAPVKVYSSGDLGAKDIATSMCTCFYVCTKCEQACDTFLEEK